MENVLDGAPGDKDARDLIVLFFPITVILLFPCKIPARRHC